MEKNERYLNVTLNSGADENKEEVILSFSALIRQLKRFLIFWLVASIIIGLLIPVGMVVFASDEHKNLSALVSFNYSGIEKGLSPNGSKFDINSMKNPEVIQRALTEMNMPLDDLENIRQGISFEGIVPTDAIDRITVYKTPYDQGKMEAAERILETSYYPTQFKVTFNYSKTSLTSNQPVELFNSILENYSRYFFEKYGFNEALGSAISGVDYESYDYSQQIDVFEDSLSSLQSYISALASNDSTRFRSTVTGMTFSDLSESIQTLRGVDLTLISSEILLNNVTKDKKTLADYYTHRIETLTHESAVAQSELNAVTASIETYQLGSVMVYGDSGSGGFQYNSGSEEYDKLFEHKISAQKTLASKQEKLKDYQKRLNMLKAQTVTTSQDQIERIESKLNELGQKVNYIIEQTNATASEYYETVYLSKSFNILVPASSSGLQVPKSVIKASIIPCFLAEAFIFAVYLGVSFCCSLVLENRKRKQEARNAEQAETAAQSTPATA